MTLNDEKKSPGPQDHRDPMVFGLLCNPKNHHFGCHLCIIMAFIRTVGGYLKISPSPQKNIPEILRILHLEGPRDICFGGPTLGGEGLGAPAVVGGLLLRREPGSDSEESRRSDLADACGAGEFKGGFAVGWWIFFLGHKKGGRGGEIDTQLS